MPITLLFEHYPSVDSTNDRIRERGRAGEAEGLVISADEQTAGKGRRGREWQSDAKSGVATSILLRPDITFRQAASLTTVAALAVVRVAKKLTGQKALIKWPNDVLLKERKVCGILCETQMTGERLDFVIVGVGINVHQTGFPAELLDKAISLDMANRTGEPISRKEVISSLWNEFSSLYGIFLKTADMSGLKQEYEEHFISMDKPVLIEKNGGTVEAIARGIDDKGALMAEIDGSIFPVETGEVSVRGLYGYI